MLRLEAHATGCCILYERNKHKLANNVSSTARNYFQNFEPINSRLLSWQCRNVEFSEIFYTHIKKSFQRSNATLGLVRISLDMVIVTPVQLGYLLVFTTMWWLLSGHMDWLCKRLIKCNEWTNLWKEDMYEWYRNKTSKVSPSRSDFDLYFSIYVFVLTSFKFNHTTTLLFLFVVPLRIQTYIYLFSYQKLIVLSRLQFYD